MKYFSYKIEHDYGLAPNPFHGYCTLSVCKSRIRKNKNLEIGDWIFGTGSVKLGNNNHLVMAMEVNEKITFDEYWNDPRFNIKKPIVNGSLVKMYGDNIYHTNQDTGEVIQENSAHSIDNETQNNEHKNRDSKGRFVLISSNYYYFGENSPLIPAEYLEICSSSRDFQYADEKLSAKFINWIRSNYGTGIHGNPHNWSEHK